MARCWACFVLAFFFRRVRGTAAFFGMLAGEAAVFWAFLFTEISFLWYNVIGCAGGDRHGAGDYVQLAERPIGFLRNGIGCK